MPNKLQSSYEIILQALNRSMDLTAHDLSLECGISEPAIRFHLRKMKNTGLIREFDSMNQGLRAGRRAHKYRIITRESASNLEDFCKALLMVVQENSHENCPSFPELMADQLLEGNFQQSRQGPGLFNEITYWLNLHHYHAGWEAGRTGPVIRLENCPYRSIRGGNDILCKVDTEILTKMTGLKWEQTECLNWETLSGECVFVVKHAA